MNKEELKKEIINKYSKNKSIFMPYKDDILYLKQNNVTLRGILEYLFKIDENIKNKYQGKEKIALTNLSKFIKKCQKNNPISKPKNEQNKIPKSPTNPVEILNSDIYITNNEYKDLL